MKSILFAFFSIISIGLFAQKNSGEDYYDNSPGIIVGTGVDFYKSNFTNNSSTYALKSSNGNFNIEYFHPVTDVLVLKAGFLMNKFNYWDTESTNPSNISTKLSSFNLSANYRFDNGIVIKKKIGFSPYIGLGVGFLSIKSSADYFSENGDNYYFWSDGTIRNADESLTANADTIYRDYNYETNVSDSLISKAGIQSFFELGIAMKFTRNITGQISYKRMLLLNDFMSGVSKIGKNDKYGYISVGIGVNFGGFKKTQDEKEIIAESTTLGNLDEDKDGIIDLNDLCAHSPEKVKVDNHGCPLDTDKDGIPDYKDVEIKSPNTNVNEKGKSYTDEELEVIYLLKMDIIAGNEKYVEYRKKYPELFKKFYGDKSKSEKVEHKTENSNTIDKNSSIDFKFKD